jgi:hypothetical protein
MTRQELLNWSMSAIVGGRFLGSDRHKTLSYGNFLLELSAQKALIRAFRSNFREIRLMRLFQQIVLTTDRCMTMPALGAKCAS